MLQEAEGACPALGYPFGDFVQKALGILPSQAGVRNGFAIAMFADFLAAWLNIAFNHNPFYHVFNLHGKFPVVHNLFYNAHLLMVLFIGI